MGRKIPTTTVMNEWVYNKLNELCRVLHDKYTINWGGCAFVAYCIARNLSEHNIPYKVVLFGRMTAEDMIRTNYACSHASIMAEEKFLINPYSIYVANTLDEHMVNLTPKELLAYYKNAKGSWNNNYDVKLNSTVSRQINNFFKTIF